MKETNNTQSDIISMMTSRDYKERFKGEYHYVKRNFDRLSAMLEKRDAGTLDFTPDCPRGIYDLQINAMADYIAVLEARAKIEGVDLRSGEAEKCGTAGNCVVLGFLAGVAVDGKGRPNVRNPEGPKGEPGANALNPYHDYDILTQDRTRIHLSDVLRNDDGEWGFHHFYDRRGVCVLSVSYDYVYSISIVEAEEGNGETG